MSASTRRLNAITIADNLYHIVFTDAEGTRLLNDPDNDDTDITLTTCQILGESLVEVAVGRALHVAPDDFQPEIGDWLSLARALDDAEAQGLWDFDASVAILDIFLTSAGLQDRLNALNEDVWFGEAFMAAETTEEEAKALMLALQAMDNAPVPVPTFDATPRLNARPANRPLSLNDQFRADAKRLGVPLETTVGALTMRDLSRLYHASMANKTIANREDVSAKAWWEMTGAVAV